MILLALPLFSQAQGIRQALVIGNGNYADLGKLRNPVNDATDIAAALGRLGFKVTLITDAGRKGMNQALNDFHDTLAQDSGSDGFFWYAGHGVQAKGENYLIPVGADIRREADLEDEAVSVRRLNSLLDDARNRVNIVVLDACRNNPLPSLGRSAARGLTVVSAAPPESLIMFSTGAGQVAADGTGRNSPFAQAFLKYLDQGGDITATIKAITAETKRLTGGTQVPYLYSSLTLDFAFNQGAGPQTPSQAPVAAQPASKPTLTVTRSYGALTISATTAGTLYLDGTAMGELPAEAEAKLDNIEVGERSLELRYAGGEKETKAATVQKGQNSSVIFTWKKASAESKKYRIGDTGPAGGIVFYDKGSVSDGWRYLEAAPSDQSSGIQWSNGKYISIKTDVAVGSGTANTKAIIAAQGSGRYAATLCKNLTMGGFSDWFLPSKDELDLMFKNLKQADRGGFGSAWYWSSSENGTNFAWLQAFDDGRQANFLKVNYFNFNVRAVRAF